MSNGSVLAGWRQRWNRNLLRFLGRRVHASVDIEDLAQETYLRLLRSRNLREVRNPQAYLIRVASHVVAEWRHSQPASLLPGADEIPEDLLVDDGVPELELDARVCEDKLNETLASLSPPMRAVVLLKLRDELSYKQIAQSLDMTERQVKRYLARGYDRLREVLEN